MPRVKPHAKIHTSLGNHRKTAEMFSDNDLLATYTRLIVLAIERFADRTNDSFIIHSREMLGITGTTRIDRALKVMDRLVASSPIALSQLADSSPLALRQLRGRTEVAWKVSIPNFAKKQGFHARNGTGMEYPPTPTPTPTPTKTTVTSRSGIAVAPEKRSPKTPKGQRSVAKSKELALEVWPELVERVASYGKTWFSKPRGKQLEMLTMRIRKGATRVQLLAAIDGFAALHADRLEDPDNPMRKYFRATTIYQASKFEEYLEAEADMSAPDARKARRERDAEDILNKLESYTEDDDDE